MEVIFDAAYRDGLDLADPHTIERLARELGLDSAQAALNEPPVKQRLRDNTEWAIAQGVFGVPTFVIGSDLFWGHDALDMVCDYLSDPAKFSASHWRDVDELPIGVVRQRRG